MKSNWIVILILVIVIGVGAFLGGMQYQKSQRQTFTQGGQFAQRRFGQNGGAVRGQILNADGNTMTVKLPDGSSKVVVVVGNTVITEATSAGKQSLQVGKQVMVFGTINSDGSVTAQNIQVNPQIRPTMQQGQGGSQN